MRSFASALSLGRGGRSDNTSTVSTYSAPSGAPRLAKARSTSLFAKAPKTPVETSSSVLSRPALTPGSSCSSDGSASLQTPEDEAMMPPFSKSDEKKRWSTWFAFRKSPDNESLGGPAQTDSAPPRTVSARKRQADKRASARPVSTQSTSESDEDEEEASSESSSGPESSTVIAHRSVAPRETVTQARANLRTLLRNSLSRPPSPPPLVETPSTLFPRSSATLGTPQQTLSLESAMHVRRMLWRLDHRTLSDTEVQSILSLARRPQPREASRNRMEKKPDDDIIAYASMRVGRYSRGLRKWALRPCFEQRFLVWMPDERGNVSCRGVMGVERGLAVCELEFSEGLEGLAGLELDDETFEQSLFPVPPPLPKKPVLSSATRRPSGPANTHRKPPFQRTPSPLRIDHSAPAEPVLSTVSPISSVTSRPPISAPILDAKTSETSRGVPPNARNGNLGRMDRHQDAAEADESIPLGYAIAAKKRREEKARFLEVERERRSKEIAAREAVERQKRDVEQHRVLEEQRRREEERGRIEEEKKAREERLKEKYNEEIAASRQRRESARLGMDNYTNIREMHQRKNEQTYTRPAYDPSSPPVKLPRRSASDTAAPGEGLAEATSPNRSRPPSMAESTHDKRRSAAPSSYNFDLPSSEEVRSMSQRRQSIAPESSQQSLQQLSSRPPSVASASSRPVSVRRAQSAPNQVPLMAYPMMPVMPQMPAIPQMPAFVPVGPVPPVPPMPVMPVWNMPLLPPNAPFMRQQYSRSPSPGSSPHSRNHSPSSSPRRQSTIPPPSPSRRQSSLHSSTPSPSRSNNNTVPSSSRSHSRNPSGDNKASQSSERRSGNGTSQLPSRSMSYSTLQQSTIQPIHHDDRFQKTRHGSSTNIANMDSKRRTSMM